MATVTTDFNVNPYYDDFDEDKGFVRVLFVQVMLFKEEN